LFLSVPWIILTQFSHNLAEIKCKSPTDLLFIGLTYLRVPY